MHGKVPITLSSLVPNVGGRSLFSRTSIECVYFRSYTVTFHVQYRLQNQTILPVVTSLWLQVILASANEWKLKT